MPGLCDVPTEILNTIFEYLFLVDVQTFITLQRTNRRIHLVAQDILKWQRSSSRYIRATGLEILPVANSWNQLLWHKFGALFVATKCFTPEERENMVYLTIANDNRLPFKRLPWAGDRKKRDAYLRLEASWRDLSVTAPGRDPITRLEIIRSYEAHSEDTVEYLYVDLQGGVLTMGTLYNLLVDDNVHFSKCTGDWELLLGKRLRDYDLMQEYECFIQEDDDLVDNGPDAVQCAILYVQGAEDIGDSLVWDVGHGWSPTIIGEAPKLLSWDEASLRPL